MAISVDYTVTPWLITIPKTDLTLDSGTKYNLTVDAFWQLLRDYADNPEGVINPVIYTRVAATASTPSITEVNDDYYVIQFEDGLYSVNIINGNTNIRDVEIKNQVSVSTNNTTGFIDPTFLEAGLFSDGVAIDILNGYEGIDKTSSGGLIGTRQNPSNNIRDAHIILDNKGFNNFYIMRDMTISDENFNVHAHKFIGDSASGITVTIEDSTVIDLCEFSEMGIRGTLDRGNVLRHCIIGDIIYFNGNIRSSLFIGSLTLGGNVNATLTDCSGNLLVDMGISGQALNVYKHSGNITITNKSGVNDNINISIEGGLVTIDSTVTAGTIIIRGNGTLKHTQTGTELVINYLVNGADISNIHWLLAMQSRHHTGVGNIWYWNPYSGDDTADGDHISRATKTFAKAHSLAYDNNHDVIMCIPGDPTGKTITTENISITKNYLQLRGPGRDFEINSADDNLNAVSIQSAGVEVSGMIVTTSANNTKWAIHSTSDFTLIKDLWVADAVNGVLFENGLPGYQLRGSELHLVYLPGRFRNHHLYRYGHYQWNNLLLRGKSPGRCGQY